MKCNVCGQEFGNGAYCQHCKADRITALGNYSGGYNAPDVPNNVTSDTNTGSSNPTSGYSSGNDSYNSAKRSGARNSGEQFMVCYNCANVIPRDSEYCPCCRIKLYEVCPKCGHRYSSQYKICNKCGTDREEYLAEQRRWEQCRLEEARRKEAEHKKVLEEERRRERQRIEEERQRQLEAKRREEERKKEEAEFIRRIESTDAYKEAYKWLIDTIAMISEKANTEKVDRQNFRSQFWGYLIPMAPSFAICIYILNTLDPSVGIAIICIMLSMLLTIFLVSPIVITILGFKGDIFLYRRQLFDHYFSQSIFHNDLSKEAIRKFEEQNPECIYNLTYNGELIQIFKELIIDKENNGLKF